ncbi:metal ABC transporter solute-binding protein, Zn/Mn family [Arthrobacter globiformis]|uniref:metal ABC transporter solute-binding protein, Zn/Mn family n=1 Tax=Arthrobacter globiformis TaxID=1665 RepID=UPI00278D13E6|nr:zinc ABC transporter substrate-binding protein [Arthrobacter globiformis]MDQ0619496.1 zinc/manganese transport system substrate-binding protein [Arthrobacter globiformis]
MPSNARTFLIAALAGFGLLLTGCGSPAASTPGADAGGRIAVVTSTNVYGDIVEAIGGEKVNVAAIISRPSQDPHSYEANAQDRLTVSKAKLVVENGGGYDDFIHTLADDSNVPHENIISAVEVSGLAPEAAGTASAHAKDGHSHDHGDFNEHVWYSLDAMSHLADAVAARLGALDSGSAPQFTANAAAFKSGLTKLESKISAMKTSHGGAGVAVTEPVPLYLLEAAGLENRTPAEYTAAVEEGADVPPAVLKAATSTVAAKDTRFLAYNEQTEGPQTQAVKNAASAAGTPVVNFTETLPDGKTYLEWMADNVENVSKALKSQR